MARKTVSVSDISGNEIEDGKGATVRVIFNDARRGVREIDVTDEEAEEFAQHGRNVARRGRKPKTTSESPAERGGSGKLAGAVSGRSTKS